jgi:hypothetical protein
MAFDPCREWLGIDAVDLDKPHLVLGLTAGETDPVAVGRAAAARLTTLNGLVPGPFAVARDALLQRVQEARDSMLAALPPPGGMAAARPPAPRIATGAATPGGHSPAVAGQGSFAFDTGSTRPHGPAHRPHHHHHHHPSRTADSGVALAALMFLLAAAAGLGGYWYASQDKADRRVASRDADRPAQRPTANDPDRNQPVRSRNEPSERPGPRPRPGTDDTPQPQSFPAQPAPFLPAPVQPSQPAPPVDDAAAARAVIAVDASLRTAFMQISGKDHAAAARTIQAARDQAGDDPDLHARIDRWGLFNDYAKEFAKHAADALKAANAGRDYALGKTRIAVIESTPTMLIYKQAGTVHRVPRERIPHDVITAIVGTWFAADGRAANHIFLGIHHLAQPQPDVAATRREWQTATNGGESMAGMMPLLDDPIIKGAARGR